MKKVNPMHAVQKSLPPPDAENPDQDRIFDAERNARAESERAGRMKDEFLANLSHELRTPINAILGWSQLIKPGESSTADVAEALEVIQRNARVQAHLIDDLLDMSRISSGKMRLELVRRVLKNCDTLVTTATSGPQGLLCCKPVSDLLSGVPKGG